LVFNAGTEGRSLRDLQRQKEEGNGWLKNPHGDVGNSEKISGNERKARTSSVRGGKKGGEKRCGPIFHRGGGKRD